MYSGNWKEPDQEYKTNRGDSLAIASDVQLFGPLKDTLCGTRFGK